MALDLSQYTNVSDPRRRNAQSFQLGNLFIDQEGGYSRDADGNRVFEGNPMNSYYMGGLGGQKLMRLDDLNADAQAHYLNTGKAFDLNGMKFISEADALPVWQALGGGADGVNAAISQYAVPALMALTGAAAGGAFGNLGTGEFAGMGTFGGGSGLVGGASGGGVSGATGGGELAAGSSAVGSSAPSVGGAAGAGAAGGASYGFGTLPDTTQWMNPTELTGQMGGLPTANTGQFGSVVDLANSANVLPAASGVTGGYTPGFLEGILNGGKSLLGSLVPGNGNGTGLNLGNVIAGLGQAGLGWLGADKQADALTGIYNQTRADRMPALSAFNAALNDPNSFYNSAPAMGATDAVLRRLSVQGNPAANPGLLSQAAAYNLGGYNDYLRALSGPAFGTTNSEINVATGAAGAQGQGLNALGFGLNTALQQPSAMDNYYNAAARRLNDGRFLP